jgi:CheY-like chemotaxis protein
MSNRKILVIDDDPDILESISVILNSENFTVITAYDGIEGLEKFKSEKPALVLCDMMMERVDAGSKVAEMIRKEDKETPIYLLSSIGDAAVINIDVNKAGFNGSLQKPVDSKVLITEIKKALKL